MKENLNKNEYELYKSTLLEDSNVKLEYERLSPEYKASRAIIAARIEKGLTQKELAELSGLKQSNISRIENMTACPTLGTLEKLAQSLGKELVVYFK